MARGWVIGDCRSVLAVSMPLVRLLLWVAPYATKLSPQLKAGRCIYGSRTSTPLLQLLSSSSSLPHIVDQPILRFLSAYLVVCFPLFSWFSLVSSTTEESENLAWRTCWLSLPAFPYFSLTPEVTFGFLARSYSPTRYPYLLT